VIWISNPVTYQGYFMSFEQFKPSRCVLLIGDDVLFIYSVTGKGIKLIDTVPWGAADFVEVVSSLIRREGRGKSVLMLNDMTDQHFKGGQRLPRVGTMDKGSVLTRRLQVAFPNYAIRGALPIREVSKGGIKSKATAGDLFLFAAVPVSDPIRKVVDSVRSSLSAIAGFTLLPIESSDMLGALAKRMTSSEAVPAKWAVFIGQHQNGALRQIITRDGQLAMTRMTPVIDTDTDPNAWADEVAQEFKATVSYLSRFGYTPDDGTDLFVIANDEAGRALGQRIGIPCNYHALTVHETANILKLNIGYQASDRYADILHVAWAGRKNKFILPMTASELQSIHRPRQVVAAAIFVAFLSGLYGSFEVLKSIGNNISVGNELSDFRKQLRSLEGQHSEEVERMKALGFDVNLVQGSMRAFHHVVDLRIKPLEIVHATHKALGDTLRLDSYSIRNIPPPTRDSSYVPKFDDAGNEILEKPRFELSMQLTFPATIEPEVGVREVLDLERRLRASFPGKDVKIEKQVADMVYTESMTGATGTAAADAADGKDYIAILSVKGDAL
jgi:hypothetical protein